MNANCASWFPVLFYRHHLLWLLLLLLYSLEAIISKNWRRVQLDYGSIIIFISFLSILAVNFLLFCCVFVSPSLSLSFGISAISFLRCHQSVHSTVQRAIVKFYRHTTITIYLTVVYSIWLFMYMSCSILKCLTAATFAIVWWHSKKYKHNYGVCARPYMHMVERPSRWPVFQGWSNGVINLDFFFSLSLSLTVRCCCRRGRRRRRLRHRFCYYCRRLFVFFIIALHHSSLFLLCLPLRFSILRYDLNRARVRVWEPRCAFHFDLVVAIYCFL